MTTLAEIRREVVGFDYIIVARPSTIYALLGLGPLKPLLHCLGPWHQTWYIILLICGPPDLAYSITYNLPPPPPTAVGTRDTHGFGRAIAAPQIGHAMRMIGCNLGKVGRVVHFNTYTVLSVSHPPHRSIM